MKFTKKDLFFSIVTGLIAGTIAWRVLTYLGAELPLGIPLGSLVVIIPIVWIIGVNLGYFLGHWMEFFNQFGKFAAIGFTNFAVSSGVLNVLLFYTGYTKGVGYSIINSGAFLVALLSSYIWNKYWAFSSDNSSDKKVKVPGEFLRFFIVTIIAFGVNLAVAAFVVNSIHPLLGLDAKAWANIGTITGSAVALVFSFVGFRMAVFKSGK